MKTAFTYKGYVIHVFAHEAKVYRPGDVECLTCISPGDTSAAMSWINASYITPEEHPPPHNVPAGGNLMLRGFLFGLPFALALWAVIILVIWRIAS